MRVRRVLAGSAPLPRPPAQRFHGAAVNASLVARRRLLVVARLLVLAFACLFVWLCFVCFVCLFVFCLFVCLCFVCLFVFCLFGWVLTRLFVCLFPVLGHCSSSLAREWRA